MPIVRSAFEPAWWLPGPHLQTIGPVLARRRPRLEHRPERVELPDGDFVDLAWAEPSPRDPEAPILLVFPGLGGSIESKYARGILRTGLARGWRSGLLHFRGASEVPNRRPRSHHAGETSDPRFVLASLRERHPRAPIGVASFSLGGSILANLLADDGAGTPVAAAVGVSVPLDLAACSARLQRGFSRLYDRYLLRELRRQLAARWPLVAPVLGGLELGRLETLEDFDDAVTAPLHGFRDAADYYARSSAGPRLGAVRVPFLVVQAEDDPFLGAALIPDPEALPPNVRVEVSRGGGHVGFVSGPHPGRARFWLDERIPAFLAPHLGGEAAENDSRVV